MKICIDPGHGGHDPGAVGMNGLEEANVALDIAHRVSHLLREHNVSIKMTRKSDVHIELFDRCFIANNWEANYFISIHLNSNGSDIVGIETLYTSDTGKVLAEPVQKAMVSETGDRDRGLKYRDDLYVLNETNMPAILVEVGFISNSDFESKFNTIEYRELLASAIVKGLVGFL